MISFSNPSADLFILDNAEPSQALGRTTHLGIGAHQDDLEVMALHGILACYQSDERWFGGVTVTNGSGSLRTNQYSDYTDEQMCAVRAEEQRKAAVVGEYAFMAQLDYPSSVVKQPGSPDFANDLQTIFSVAKPRVVYTHNLADKHDTHVAVVVPVIQALRELPETDRPAGSLWRGGVARPELVDRRREGVARHERPAESRSGADQYFRFTNHRRQTLRPRARGRLRGNATFFDSHAVDQSKMASYAMDLKPLVDDPRWISRSLSMDSSSVSARMSARVWSVLS